MIEVHYMDVPLGIQEKTSFTGSRISVFSEPGLLVQYREESLAASLELGGWPLDGTREIAPAVPLWSEKPSALGSGYLGAGELGKLTLNSRNTALETPAVLAVDLTEPTRVSGITLAFSPREGQWCSKIHIRWLLRGEVIWEEDAWPAGPRWEIPCTSEAFDRMEIKLLETNLPGRFAKLHQLFWGQVLVFSREELKAVELVNEADPSMDELTVDTMTVEIQNTRNRNLDPRKDQRMELYRNGKLLASHTIENCTRKEGNHYTFTCRSGIGKLEDTFLGGIYDRAPLAGVLEEILQDTPFQLAPELADSVVTGYLPVCTCRQALQQVAFAVGALVSTYGSQKICLNPVPELITGSFSRSALFQGGTMETASGVSHIEVLAHQYTPISDRQTLIEGEVLNGENILLTFSEPHHSYEITGGTLVQQGANHIVVSAKGEVTVTAGVYRHSTVRHRRECTAMAGVCRDQIRKVENATLVHSGNAVRLLDRLSRFYAQQQTLTQTVVVDDQYVGQKVTLEDPWGNPMEGYITKMHSDLTAVGHTAAITVMGMWQSPEIAKVYAGGLYAGNKEVGL